MNLFKKASRTPPEEIDLAALDKDSAYRKYTGWKNILTIIILATFTTFQIYASVSGRIPQQEVRYLHLGFAVALAYWLYPAGKKSNKESASILDLILLFTFIGVIGYCIVNYTALQQRAGAYTSADIVVGLIAIVLVIEACRRVVGLPIVIIACLFILYARFGAYMPGFLRHRGYQLPRIVTHLFYTTEGIIGAPLGVSSTFIFLFIMFGSFLERTGIGQFFIDIANAIAGHAPGGPAKVAILSSALQGTVSGSSVANTVATGSFTIPMMKKLGYKPEFAGAVEAAASTGGQIMPPVMGAAAFLIADAIGIPYMSIVKAAIIPALLYFTGIWVMVDLEAKRLRLKGLPKDQLPNWRKLLVERGHLMIPLISIVVFLCMGYTTTRAALFGTIACIVVPFL